MGMFSKMIHVAPVDLSVDLSKIDPEILQRIFSGTLDEENDKEMTLGELKENYYESRLYGYLLPRALKEWQDFLLAIGKQHPDVKEIEFHFTYEDGDVPYYFHLDNENKNVTFGMGVHDHHLYYDESDLDSDDEDNRPIFNETKYLAIYKDLMKNDPSHFKVQTFDEMINNSLNKRRRL